MLNDSLGCRAQMLQEVEIGLLDIADITRWQLCSLGQKKMEPCQNPGRKTRSSGWNCFLVCRGHLREERGAATVPRQSLQKLTDIAESCRIKLAKNMEVFLCQLRWIGLTRHTKINFRIATDASAGPSLFADLWSRKASACSSDDGQISEEARLSRDIIVRCMQWFCGELQPEACGEQEICHLSARTTKIPVWKCTKVKKEIIGAKWEGNLPNSQ